MTDQLLTATFEVMSDGRLSKQKSSELVSKLLSFSAASWVGIALLGQLMFAAYVVLVFWMSALKGNIEQWGKLLPSGLIVGDVWHNIALVLHVLFAVVVMVAGTLQMLPAIRRRYPKLHRWSGRFFVIGVLTAALGGLVLTWKGEGGPGDLAQHIGITFNAILIFVFAAFAWTTARSRQFDRHRKWALRLYIAANGVWFFRLMLPLWILLYRAPVGFDPKTFTGPFLNFLSFACYLLPLAVLELYLSPVGWVEARNPTLMLKLFETLRDFNVTPPIFFVNSGCNVTMK